MSKEINWALISQNAETNYTLLYKRNQQLEQKNEKLQSQVAMMRAEFICCFEDMVDWAGYASQYFQDKHDLKGDIERYTKALSETASSDAWMNEQHVKWMNSLEPTAWIPENELRRLSDFGFVHAELSNIRTLLTKPLYSKPMDGKS